MIIVGDDGLPVAAVDPERIESDAVRLAYAMAAHSDCPAELDQIAAETLARVGVDAFGYVAAAALRMLTEHILEPTLKVTDRMHEVGALSHDLRAGLADALRNAEGTLGGGRR